MIKTPFTTSTPIKPSQVVAAVSVSEGDQQDQHMHVHNPERKTSLVRLGDSGQPQARLNGDWMRFFNTPNIDVNPPQTYDFRIKDNGTQDDAKITTLAEFNNLAQLLKSTRSMKSSAEEAESEDKSSLQMVAKTGNASSSIGTSGGSGEGSFGSEADEFRTFPNLEKTFDQTNVSELKSSFSTEDNPPADGHFADMPKELICFQRKYQPTPLMVAPKPHVAKATDELAQVYESRVDKILRIMNTSNSDYAKHRIRVTQIPSASRPRHSTGLHTNITQNYSLYVLFFMIASNLIGLTLSLTYQVLLFFKLNADRFLNHSWSHWQHATVLQRENNIVTLVLMLPLILAVLVAYVSIWLAYNVNRLLLTSVPDRLADLINFNIQIVQ